jgi:hypothetical protein
MMYQNFGLNHLKTDCLKNEIYITFINSILMLARRAAAPISASTIYKSWSTLLAPQQPEYCSCVGEQCAWTVFRISFFYFLIIIFLQKFVEIFNFRSNFSCADVKATLYKKLKDFACTTAVGVLFMRRWTVRVNSILNFSFFTSW